MLYDIAYYIGLWTGTRAARFSSLCVCYVVNVFSLLLFVYLPFSLFVDLVDLLIYCVHSCIALIIVLQCCIIIIIIIISSSSSSSIIIIIIIIVYCIMLLD